MSEKSRLVVALKKKNIPLPEKQTVVELQHRFDNWDSPNGWLVRLAKPASRKPNHPVTLLQTKDTYWLPDSNMARSIVESKLVFFMGRTNKIPSDATLLDVPKDYNDRWGVKVTEEE